MDDSSLKPGDKHYRAYIDPPLQYDFMGATQFRLLCSLGLRAHHKVLDLGCGSLRAGRFLINYLEPGNYCGIEPNKWLIDEGIKEQVGDSLIAIKKPRFDTNSEFNTTVFAQNFDFIIAQSIFSHTGNDLIPDALSNIYKSLNDNGIALLAFIKGEKDFGGDGWIYPECVEFTLPKIYEFAANAGFQVQELPWYHPRQTWFYFIKNDEKKLRSEELKHLSGAVLHDKTFEKSLHVKVENRQDDSLHDKPVNDVSKTLICTGFHRSATSATANYLNNAGLHMGNELMGNSISNPKGHFEDWAVVRLHDEQLAKNDTDWQYHDEVSLDIAPDFLNKYIKLRNSHHSVWGVKDPRVCLFLNEWNEALEGQGNFLFVARHWSSCIESLLHRHSREFANQLPENLENDKRLEFWRKPDLAAKMWLAYNDRLLAFAKKHPSKSLIVTQRALFNGAPILKTLNNKFKLGLNESAESPIESKMLRDQASTLIPDMLSSHLKARLEHVWQELLERAELRHTNEDAVYFTPEFTSISQLPSSFREAYLSKCRELAKESNTLKEAPTTEITWPKEKTEEVVTHWLSKYPRKNLTEAQLTQVHNFIEEHFPLSANIWLEMAKVYQQKACYNEAVSCFQQAVTLGAQFPYINMHLGQCYQRLDKPVEACFYLDKALKLNPNNANFYVAKAQVLIERGEGDSAEQCLRNGIDLLGYLLPLVIKLSDYLLNKQRHKEVGTLLDSCTNQSHLGLASLRNRLALQNDYDKGVEIYYREFKKVAEEQSQLVWLAEAVRFIDSGTSEMDFLCRIFSMWILIKSLPAR